MALFSRFFNNKRELNSNSKRSNIKKIDFKLVVIFV